MNFQSNGLTYKDHSAHMNTVKDTTSHIVQCSNVAGDLRLVTVSVAPCVLPPLPRPTDDRLWGIGPASISISIPKLCLYLQKVLFCINKYTSDFFSTLSDACTRQVRVLAYIPTTQHEQHTLMATPLGHRRKQRTGATGSRGSK